MAESSPSIRPLIAITPAGSAGAAKKRRHTPNPASVTTSNTVPATRRRRREKRSASRASGWEATRSGASGGLCSAGVAMLAPSFRGQTLAAIGGGPGGVRGEEEGIPANRQIHDRADGTEGCSQHDETGHHHLLENSLVTSHPKRATALQQIRKSHVRAASRSRLGHAGSTRRNMQQQIHPTCRVV